MVSFNFSTGGRNRYFFISDFNLKIPLRIASAFSTISCSQYFFKISEHSLSSRTVIRSLLGFSTFGLPVRGLTSSPHFLSATKYIIFIVCQKVKDFFIFQSTSLRAIGLVVATVSVRGRVLSPLTY